MKNVEQIILDALKDSRWQGDDGELAYLALTSKVEQPFRDRLAWIIQKKNCDSGSIVAREWKARIDLAVLDSSKAPLALIELKAMHAFDLHTHGGSRAFRSAVDEDSRKLARFRAAHALSQAACITLVTVTACDSHPAKEFEGIVKYRSKIENAGIVSAQALDQKIADCFSAQNCPKGHISIGKAFGVGVRIHYALISVP